MKLTSTPPSPAPQASIRERMRKLAPYFGWHKGMWAMQTEETPAN